MLTSNRYFFFIVLFLSSTGQLASDVYLPSLPAIATYLHTTIGYTQLSVSVYMIGYACAQVIYGPLSDGFGRKKPLLVGLVLLLIGSIVCLQASTVNELLMGRFLQGIGAAGAATIGRVLLFDVYSGVKLVKFNSYLSMAVVVVVAAAPLIGGYIEVHSSWQGNFVFLAAFCLITLLLCLLLLPETHLSTDIAHVHPSTFLKNLKALLGSRFFMGCCLVLLLTYGGILAWLTSGPELVQERLHYSPVFFGWVAFSMGLCYMVGSWFNALLASRMNVNALLSLGMIVMCLSAVLMLLMSVITFNIWWVVIPTGFFIGGSSMVFSNIYVVAMQQFKEISGFAGSLLGCVQTLGGGVAGILVASLDESTQMPLALILTGCAGGALFLFLVCIRSREQHLA